MSVNAEEIALMQSFRTYLENIDLFAIVDAAVILAVLVLTLIFFIRRNNIKLAIAAFVYIVAFVVVGTISALSPTNILYLTYLVLRIVGFFLIVAFCVVYQQDLKAFCSKMGRWKDKSQLGYSVTDDDLRIAAGEIVKACQTMSKNDIGALIILAPDNVPNHILDTGTVLNAMVSSGLLQSIFNKNAPLHDGAVVIKDAHILGAGCFLPISQRTDISKDLGTRHRAAIGISEESNVLAIVVSEETGVISTIRKGEIKRYMTPEKLLEQIEGIYGIDYMSRGQKKRKNDE